MKVTDESIMPKMPEVPAWILKQKYRKYPNATESAIAKQAKNMIVTASGGWGRMLTENAKYFIAKLEGGGGVRGNVVLPIGHTTMDKQMSWREGLRVEGEPVIVMERDYPGLRLDEIAELFTYQAIMLFRTETQGSTSGPDISQLDKTEPLTSINMGANPDFDVLNRQRIEREAYANSVLPSIYYSLKDKGENAVFFDSGKGRHTGLHRPAWGSGNKTVGVAIPLQHPKEETDLLALLIESDSLTSGKSLFIQTEELARIIAHEMNTLTMPCSKGNQALIYIAGGAMGGLSYNQVYDKLGVIGKQVGTGATNSTVPYRDLLFRKLGIKISKESFTRRSGDVLQLPLSLDLSPAPEKVSQQKSYEGTQELGVGFGQSGRVITPIINAENFHPLRDDHPKMVQYRMTEWVPAVIEFLRSARISEPALDVKPRLQSGGKWKDMRNQNAKVKEASQDDLQKAIDAFAVPNGREVCISYSTQSKTAYMDFDDDKRITGIPQTNDFEQYCAQIGLEEDATVRAILCPTDEQSYALLDKVTEIEGLPSEIGETLNIFMPLEIQIYGLVGESGIGKFRSLAFPHAKVCRNMSTTEGNDNFAELVNDELDSGIAARILLRFEDENPEMNLYGEEVLDAAIIGYDIEGKNPSNGMVGKVLIALLSNEKIKIEKGGKLKSLNAELYNPIGTVGAFVGFEPADRRAILQHLMEHTTHSDHEGYMMVNPEEANLVVRIMHKGVQSIKSQPVYRLVTEMKKYDGPKIDIAPSIVDSRGSRKSEITPTDPIYERLQFGGRPEVVPGQTMLLTVGDKELPTLRTPSITGFSTRVDGFEDQFIGDDDKFASRYSKQSEKLTFKAPIEQLPIKPNPFEDEEDDIRGNPPTENWSAHRQRVPWDFKFFVTYKMDDPEDRRKAIHMKGWNRRYDKFKGVHAIAGHLIGTESQWAIQSIRVPRKYKLRRTLREVRLDRKRPPKWYKELHPQTKPFGTKKNPPPGFNVLQAYDPNEWRQELDSITKAQSLLQEWFPSRSMGFADERPYSINATIKHDDMFKPPLNAMISEFETIRDTLLIHDKKYLHSNGEYRFGRTGGGPMGDGDYVHASSFSLPRLREFSKKGAIMTVIHEWGHTLGATDSNVRKTEVDNTHHCTNDCVMSLISYETEAYTQQLISQGRWNKSMFCNTCIAHIESKKNPPRRVYTTHFDFEPGRFYTFDELPGFQMRTSLKEDAIHHFRSIEDGGYGLPGKAEDALYRAVLLDPKPIRKKYSGKKWEDFVGPELLKSIEKDGLMYPSIGNEGNHRMIAMALLGREIPALEILTPEQAEGVYTHHEFWSEDAWGHEKKTIKPNPEEPNRWTMKALDSYFLKQSGYTKQTANVKGLNLEWLVVSPQIHALPWDFNDMGLFFQHRPTADNKYHFIMSDQFELEVMPYMAYTEYLEHMEGYSVLDSAKEGLAAIDDPDIRNKFASQYAKLLKYEAENWRDIPGVTQSQAEAFRQTADYLTTKENPIMPHNHLEAMDEGWTGYPTWAISPTISPHELKGNPLKIITSDIITISGPSGSGKSTIAKYLKKKIGKTARIVPSVMTRKRRPREVEGVDGIFITKKKFKEMIKRGEFTSENGTDLWVLQKNKHYYGRRAADFERSGVAIVDVSFSGLELMREAFPDKIYAVLIKTRMRKERRIEVLKARGIHTDEEIKQRVNIGTWMMQKENYEPLNFDFFAANRRGELEKNVAMIASEFRKTKKNPTGVIPLKDGVQEISGGNVKMKITFKDGKPHKAKIIPRKGFESNIDIVSIMHFGNTLAQELDMEEDKKRFLEWWGYHIPISTIAHEAMHEATIGEYSPEQLTRYMEGDIQQIEYPAYIGEGMATSALNAPPFVWEAYPDKFLAIHLTERGLDGSYGIRVDEYKTNPPTIYDEDGKVVKGSWWWFAKHEECTKPQKESQKMFKWGTTPDWWWSFESNTRPHTHISFREWTAMKAAEKKKYKPILNWDMEETEWLTHGRELFMDPKKVLDQTSDLVKVTYKCEGCKRKVKPENYDNWEAKFVPEIKSNPPKLRPNEGIPPEIHEHPLGPITLWHGTPHYDRLQQIQREGLKTDSRNAVWASPWRSDAEFYAIGRGADYQTKLQRGQTGLLIGIRGRDLQHSNVRIGKHPFLGYMQLHADKYGKELQTLATHRGQEGVEITGRVPPEYLVFFEFDAGQGVSDLPLHFTATDKVPVPKKICSNCKGEPIDPYDGTTCLKCGGSGYEGGHWTEYPMFRPRAQYPVPERVQFNPPATMLTGSQNIPAKSMNSGQGLIYTGMGTFKQAEPGEVLTEGWGRETLPKRYKKTRAPIDDPQFSELPAEARAWKKATFKSGAETEFGVWQENFQTKYKDRPYIATLKVDGEGVMAHYDGKETVIWNWYDRWRTGFHITDELTKLLKKKKVKSVKLMGELYALDRYGKMLTLSGGERDPDGMSETVTSIIKTTGDKSTMERQNRIRLAVFDILELNGKDLRGLPFEERIKIASKLVKGGKTTHLVPMQSGVGMKPMMKLWEEGMEEPEFEGVVIRFNDTGKTFKVKGVATADLAIIGFYHGGITDTGSLQNAVGGMALAFMDKNGDYVYAGNTGSFRVSHDERHAWVHEFLYPNLLKGIKDQTKTKWGSHLVDPNNKHMANGHGAMWPVKPTKIAEVHYLRASFKENPVYRVVGDELVQVGIKRSPTLGGPPVFKRFRDDKSLTPEDLRIEQLPAEGEGKWLDNPEDESGYPGGMAQKMMDSILIGSLTHMQGGVYLGHPGGPKIKTSNWQLKYPGLSSRLEEAKKRGFSVPSLPRLKENPPKPPRILKIPKVEVWEEYFTPTMVRKHPDHVFVFGDNEKRTGKKGQAQIRGLPNAKGLRTKRSGRPNRFWSDEDYFENIKMMRTDLMNAIDCVPEGGTLVLPAAGLGTGLAELPQKAPKTYAWLREISEMLTMTKDIGQSRRVRK